MSDVGDFRGPGVVLRHGELFLKGGNRRLFELALERNARRALRERPEVQVRPEHGRLFVLGAADDDVLERLRWLFGAASLSPAVFTARDPAAIGDCAVALARENVGAARTFRIAARRADKSFPLTSTELAREVGRTVGEAIGLPVDLERPDLTVGIEIGRSWTFLWVRDEPGGGGLPVGTSGKALLLLSGGIDSPVAGHLMQKRGVELAAVYFHAFPYTGDGARDKMVDLARVLTRRQERLPLWVVSFTRIQEALRDSADRSWLVLLYRRAMVRVAGRIAARERLGALVTGESLGQVASQTMANLATIEDASPLPILRPLVGFDKAESIALAKRIGTFEISIRPHQDCCTLFLPSHPETKGNPARAATLESRLDLQPLIQEAADSAEAVEV
ncbi:MAG TPA: tRNA uracil 4-sulfurtransferase ThiI [Polyangia bacterium]|nr:tRNA uracil 4-sulfurtransferase ThiI [Polyangia bacterium]